MRRILATAALSAGLLAAPPLAAAGVYSDDLGKCLVRASSIEDQKTLVTWIFAAMSSHPDLKGYSRLSAADVDAWSRKAGALMQRLITVDCRKEAVAVVKYEDSSALPASFNLLGQAAMRGLMSDPNVRKGMEGLVAGVDPKSLEGLAKEAGVPEALGPARK